MKYTDVFMGTECNKNGTVATKIMPTSHRHMHNPIGFQIPAVSNQSPEHHCWRSAKISVSTFSNEATCSLDLSAPPTTGHNWCRPCLHWSLLDQHHFSFLQPLDLNMRQGCQQPPGLVGWEALTVQTQTGELILLCSNSEWVSILNSLNTHSGVELPTHKQPIWLS